MNCFGVSIPFSQNPMGEKTAKSPIQPNFQIENTEEDKIRPVFRFINRDTVPGRSTGIYVIYEFSKQVDSTLFELERIVHISTQKTGFTRLPRNQLGKYFFSFFVQYVIKSVRFHYLVFCISSIVGCSILYISRSRVCGHYHIYCCHDHCTGNNHDCWLFCNGY